MLFNVEDYYPGNLKYGLTIIGIVHEKKNVAVTLISLSRNFGSNGDEKALNYLIICSIYVEDKRKKCRLLLSMQHSAAGSLLY